MEASIRKKQFLKQIGKDYPMNFLYYAMQLYPNHPILFVKSLCRCKQDTRFVTYVKDVILNIYRAERKRIGYLRRKLFV